MWSTHTSKDFKPTSKDFSMVKQSATLFPCFVESTDCMYLVIYRISLNRSLGKWAFNNAFTRYIFVTSTFKAGF